MAQPGEQSFFTHHEFVREDSREERASRSRRAARQSRAFFFFHASGRFSVCLDAGWSPKPVLFAVAVLLLYFPARFSDVQPKSTWLIKCRGSSLACFGAKPLGGQSRHLVGVLRMVMTTVRCRCWCSSVRSRLHCHLLFIGLSFVLAGWREIACRVLREKMARFAVRKSWRRCLSPGTRTSPSRFFGRFRRKRPLIRKC